MQHSHRRFLLTRDLAGLAALALVDFSVVGIAFAPSWRAAGVYALVRAAQFLLVRHAASTYGARFVCTVMAV